MTTVEPTPQPLHLVTKDQLTGIIRSWMGESDTTQPPKKAETLYISWPIVRRIAGEPTSAKITVHDQKSTYGKTLYRIELSA